MCGWDEDLKKLKHYRWIRNKIVHEPDCREEDMFTREDVEWINGFYDRVMNGTDPLALYYKTRVKPKKNVAQSDSRSLKIKPRKEEVNKSAFDGAPIIGFLFMLVLIVVMWFLFGK